MAPKKNAKPKILKVVRTDTFVEIVREIARTSEQKTVPNSKEPGKTDTKTVTSSSEFKEKSHEAPLESFDEALQALAPVAAVMIGCDSDWAKNVSVLGVAFSFTEHGIRSAQILFSKPLLGGETIHPLKTPMFQIDDGKTPDQGRRQCAPKQAEKIVEFIKEAQRYADGERSQTLLDFQDDSDDEDTNPDNVEQLPGMGAAPTKDAD